MNDVNPEAPKGSRSEGLTSERAKLEARPSKVGAFPHVRRTCLTASEKEPKPRNVRFRVGAGGKAPTKQLPDAALYDVMTIGEIMQQYQMTRKNVIYALYAKYDPLVGRKAAGTWLITRESVEKRWGKPRWTPVNKRGHNPS